MIKAWLIKNCRVNFNLLIFAVNLLIFAVNDQIAVFPGRISFAFRHVFLFFAVSQFAFFAVFCSLHFLVIVSSFSRFIHKRINLPWFPSSEFPAACVNPCVILA